MRQIDLLPGWIIFVDSKEIENVTNGSNSPLRSVPCKPQRNKKENGTESSNVTPVEWISNVCTEAFSKKNIEHTWG